MSYSQFGYSGYPSSANSSSLSSQILSSGSSLSSPTTTCETTPPPHNNNNNSSTQASNMYSTSAGLLSYPRVAGLTDTVYTSAYATQGYVPFGADPSAFYSPLNPDNTDAWRSLSSTAGWPYDPNSMAGYPYGTSYGGLDVRRKNATRESTSTLKAWLYEHIKNPYPTKGEKIMLAIITKMTLTQVSTWFANARRRLKKENKMQWSPRNRSGEDDDHKSDDENDDVDGADSQVDPLRDQSNNNNNKLTDVNTDDLTATTFDGLLHHPQQPQHHNGSSHKDILTSRGHHMLENGQSAFGSLRRDSEDPLHIRRDDDEDIVVDGGDPDPLSRLDFSTPDHGLSAQSRLKPEIDLHHPQPATHSHPHKLDGGFGDGSPLSDLSTPLGSPSHSLGHDSLLSPLAGKLHCSSAASDAENTKVCGDDASKPRIWSLADVATSTSPGPGRRTPGITVNSGMDPLGHTKACGLTAFTAPVSAQGIAGTGGFQPWMNGSGYPTATNSSCLTYQYPINPHPSLGNSGTMAGHPGAHRTDLAAPMSTLGGLNGNSPYGNKLASSFMGDKSSLSQFSSGFSSGMDVPQTAFKPVAKRL